MNRRISAEIPRVKIDFEGKSLFHPLRKQSRADGCSTLEAALTLLKELGESQSSINTLQHVFKVFIDSVMLQKQRPIIHGSFSAEQVKEMKRRENSKART